MPTSVCVCRVVIIPVPPFNGRRCRVRSARAVPRAFMHKKMNQFASRRRVRRSSSISISFSMHYILFQTNNSMHAARLSRAEPATGYTPCPKPDRYDAFSCRCVAVHAMFAFAQVYVYICVPSQQHLLNNATCIHARELRYIKLVLLLWSLSPATNTHTCIPTAPNTISAPPRTHTIAIYECVSIQFKSRASCVTHR